jgi:hypothetical protein
MNLPNQFPKIKIISLEKVRLHENHDPQRTPPLIERLESDGILLNPPIMAQFKDCGDEYMVLDGANRVTAFRSMGIPHILAQVVDPDSPSLSLQTWNHVIWDMPQGNFLDLVTGIDGISAKAYAGELLDFKDDTIALIQMPNMGLYRLVTEDQSMRIKLLNEIVEAYKPVTRYDRTHIEEIRKIINLYKDLAALVIYPNFSIEEIIANCRINNLLPAGVTRFLISPRALRMNYPIEKLAGGQSLEEKNLELEDFIKQRMELKGVRVYTETTILYDE